MVNIMAKKNSSKTNRSLKKINKFNERKEDEIMQATSITIGEKKIFKIQQISNNEVMTYFDTLPRKEQAWIIQRMAEIMEDKGARGYFPSFRAEFVKRYFPELIANKTSRQTKSTLETLMEKFEKGNIA